MRGRALQGPQDCGKIFYSNGQRGGKRHEKTRCGPAFLSAAGAPAGGSGPGGGQRVLCGGGGQRTASDGRHHAVLVRRLSLCTGVGVHRL